MKKIIYTCVAGLFVGLATVLLIAWFQPEKLTPSESIEEFHKAAETGDTTTAKAFITTDILTGFENGAFPHYGSFGGFLSDYRSKYKNVTPLYKTEKINGNSASVDVMVSYKNGTKSKETYYLIKEDGEWKISE